MYNHKSITLRLRLLNEPGRFNKCLVTLLICLAFSTITGCHHTVRQKHESRARESGQPVLTFSQALSRSQQVTNLRYDLYLDLMAPSEREYSGRVSIYLDHKPSGKPLRIDFHQGSIHRLLVNSTTVTPDYNGYFIEIPAHSLKASDNIIEIEFTHSYAEHASNSPGLTRFRDSHDNSTYIFSHGFPPYSTSQIFPLFDQPDLQAAYKLTLKVPPEWEVVSASQKKQTINGKTYRWWYFKETVPLGPHQFALQAGPFETWQHEKFPVRLLTRQSVSADLKANAWLNAAVTGKKLAERYLDQNTPFFKYDMVLVPDLNETFRPLAATALFDEHLFTGAEGHSSAQLQQPVLESLIVSWLGNQIVINWWNDIWLPESLARYLSYLLAETIAAPDMPQSGFYLNVKRPALAADQEQYSVPINRQLENTSQWQADTFQFRVNKSASLLKQLHHQLGNDAFRQGIQQFLLSRKSSTTTTTSSSAASFFDVLESTSGKPLGQWQKQWLETRGIPVISTEFQCKNSQLQQLLIHQHDAGKRSQSIGIGLFRQKNETLQRYRTLPVTLTGKTTKVAIPGKQPCPDYVLANIDDNGYLQVNPEQLTQKAILEQTFSSPLIRAMIWQALMQSSQPIKTILDYAFKKIPDETDPELLQNMLKDLRQLHDNLQRSLVSAASQHLINHRLINIEEFAWQQLTTAEPETAAQRIWFEFFVAVTSSEAGIQQLKDLLDQRRVISGLQLQQHQRWSMLVKLNSLDARGAWTRAKQELQHSPDERDQFQQVDASRPDSLIKIQWLNQLPQLAPPQAQAISQVLFPASQYKLVSPIRQDIMNVLARLPYPQALKLSDNLLGECSSHGIQFLEKQLRQPDSLKVAPVLRRKISAARKCISLNSRQ